MPEEWPDWINNTPAAFSFDLTMSDSYGRDIVRIDLKRAEFIRLKTELAEMRGHASRGILRTFSDQPLRNRIAIVGAIVLFVIAMLCAAFDIGMEHQKEVGPHGTECADGTYRQPGAPGGAAVCTNGFWFWLAPEAFPRDKLEDEKK